MMLTAGEGGSSSEVPITTRPSDNSNFISRNADTTLPIQKYDGSSKHTPFFNQYNSKKLRKTNMELRVDFGNKNPNNQTIKHLYLRSKGIEIDASGNPLFEIFEFVAQDIVESDNKFVESK